MINPGIERTSSPVTLIFQFHIGMINPYMTSNFDDERLISIPHWYD